MDAGGSGAIDDPYVVTNAEEFDTVMFEFSDPGALPPVSCPNVTFHLGAGDFSTNGYGDGVGWVPLRGWRFVGAGMDVTTLTLDTDGTYTSHKEYFIIGAPDDAIADGFEIQDLTLDANLHAISPAIAAGGVKVFGSSIRIHDIRVINFGTKTNQLPGRAIVTAGAYPTNPEPFDCVIEDCEIVFPFRNNYRETHCLVLAGGEGSTDGFMAYHKGCVVRNNYVDCHYSNNEVAVSRIEILNDPARLARVTIRLAHGLSNDDSVTIWGALEQSAWSTRFNGSFVISNSSGSQFEITYPTMGAVEPTGDMYVNRVLSQRARIASLVHGAGNEWTLTTTAPHYRGTGEIVVLNNVKESGELSVAFNNHFVVTAVTSPYQLTFDFPSGATPDVTDAWIGVDFYGITTAGGRGVIVEGNRLHSVTFGYYHDKWSTIDVTIRDNHFLGVLCGVYGKLGQVSDGGIDQQPSRAGQALNATGTTAEFETVDPHGFAKGAAVLIAEASIGAYNGMFKIDSVPSPKKFRYTTLTPPGGSATGMKFGALWRVGRWIIENNAIDIVGTITTGFDPPTAIRLDRTVSDPVAPTSPYVFGQIVIIANVIRMSEAAFDSTTTPLGIKLNSCEQAIVEDNVLNLLRATPIEFVACGAIKFFNNQSPSGKLLQGYDVPNSRLLNELETDVDLAAVSVM